MTGHLQRRITKDPETKRDAVGPWEPCPKCGPPSESRVGKLRQLLNAYGAFWEVGDIDVSPWPGDPDGGELRVVRALHDVLEHLSPEGLALAEELLVEGSREYGPADVSPAERCAVHGPHPGTVDCVDCVYGVPTVG